MNLYLILAAVFFFGVVVGDAGRNFFGGKSLAQRAQTKRLILENAQLRQRIDERLSENS